jgi:hypothetical protein
MENVSNNICTFSTTVSEQTTLEKTQRSQRRQLERMKDEDGILFKQIFTPSS